MTRRLKRVDALTQPERLRLAIERSGLTQREVADALGVAQRQVSTWATGARKIPQARIPQLEDVTGYRLR